MTVTERQLHLLRNLDDITSRSKTSGLRGYFLAGQDCTPTVNSLIVKGLVRKSVDQTRLHKTGLMHKLAT